MRTEVENGNPWKFNYLKATKVWNKGDVTEVMSKPEEEVGELGA